MSNKREAAYHDGTTLPSKSLVRAMYARGAADFNYRTEDEYLEEFDLFMAMYSRKLVQQTENRIIARLHREKEEYFNERVHAVLELAIRHVKSVDEWGPENIS